METGVTGEPFLIDRAGPPERRSNDRTMYLLSKAGDHGLVWIGATVLQGRLQHRPVGWTVRTLLWLGFESAVVNLGMKRLFQRPRPTSSTTHPSSFRIPTDTSFPSGHAAAAALMAVQLADNNPLGVGWALLAGGIGLSRVRLGVHHTSDVLCGFAIGTIFGLAARAADPSERSGAV